MRTFKDEVLSAMIEENQQLVTYELVDFEN